MSEQTFGDMPPVAKMRMHPELGWESRGESKLSEVICHRCSERVHVPGEPTIFPGWREWADAMSELVTQLHCPTEPQKLGWFTRMNLRIDGWIAAHAS